MTQRMRRLGGRTVWVPLALVSAAALALPASAAPPATAAAPRVLSYNCQGQTPIGPVRGFAYQDLYSATAPTQVQSGQVFNIVIRPDFNRLPQTIDNRLVHFVRNITLSVPLPSNSTVQGYYLSGAYRTGPVSAYISGGNMVLNIPGPLSPRSPFRVPDVTLKVKAGPSANGPVKTTLGNYSTSNPSLTFDARIRGRRVLADVPTGCYPQPDGTLTSTTVT